jgi:hypothetical protein
MAQALEIALVPWEPGPERDLAQAEPGPPAGGMVPLAVSPPESPSDPFDEQMQRLMRHTLQNMQRRTAAGQ